MCICATIAINGVHALKHLSMNPRVHAYIQFVHASTHMPVRNINERSPQAGQCGENPFVSQLYLGSSVCAACAYAAEGLGESVILGMPLKHDVCLKICVHVLMYARICDHVCPGYVATIAFGYKVLDRYLVYVSGSDH